MSCSAFQIGRWRAEDVRAQVAARHCAQREGFNRSAALWRHAFAQQPVAYNRLPDSESAGERGNAAHVCDRRSKFVHVGEYHAPCFYCQHIPCLS